MKKSTLNSRLKNSLRCGTGEAYLIVKNNPTIDFSKQLIYAATHDLAYDAQCEQNRAKYIYSIICLTTSKEKIIKGILDILLNKKDDDWWALEQMCEIAMLIAKDGHKIARTILYKRFQKNLKKGYTYCGNESIMKLDGMDGLVMIADVVGQILQRDPDDWEDSSRLDYFQENNPDIDVYKTIEKAAKKNKNIKAYLNSIKANNKLRSKRTRNTAPTKYTYDSIKEQIGKVNGFFLAQRVQRDLSQNDIILLANDFLNETDTKKRAIYLRIFSYNKFPLDYKYILEIVKSKGIQKKDLFYYGIEALSLFSSDKLREFALANLSKSRNTYQYLPLLVSNYKKGDHKLILHIIEKTYNENNIHYIAVALNDIYLTNPSIECKKPIEAIYQKLNCSIHREDLMRILISNNVLSKRIKEEIQYDCRKSIQELLVK